MLGGQKLSDHLALFDTYFSYYAETEVPLIFHRWSLVSSVGAFLGRRVYLPFGPWRVFPNLFVMLIGSPGTRKSTAINAASKLLSMAGYTNFSANKTRLEKFLLDLEGTEEEKKSSANIVLQNIFGKEEDVSGLDPCEVFINAGEFNVFMPRGDMDFLGLLGDLWDWDDETRRWQYRLKNSKSVHIFQPTISMLAGNTHAGFQDVFPPQSIGQGFLSRLILVYAEQTGKKIAFPKIPVEQARTELLDTLVQIKEKVTGAATITPPARTALEMIYKTWPEIQDHRFLHYSTRRFTQLLKLCLICAATRVTTQIDMQDVLLASTLLSFTEKDMPKALGEFGKSKHAEAANKVMSVLYAAKKPVKLEALWQVVQNDLDKVQDLAVLLQNLQSADKIQAVKAEGFLPKQRPFDTKLVYVDYNLLKEYKDGK